MHMETRNAEACCYVRCETCSLTQLDWEFFKNSRPSRAPSVHDLCRILLLLGRGRDQVASLHYPCTENATCFLFSEQTTQNSPNCPATHRVHAFLAFQHVAQQLVKLQCKTPEWAIERNTHIWPSETSQKSTENFPLYAWFELYLSCFTSIIEKVEADHKNIPKPGRSGSHLRHLGDQVSGSFPGPASSPPYIEKGHRVSVGTCLTKQNTINALLIDHGLHTDPFVNIS